ncbi:MAG: prolipoprotein diacylglyceryl transferase [Acidimicrobiales bacterium]|nr:prolipoprotein diacylglyceryl transferase [Acidimicrobiales bacterium]
MKPIPVQFNIGPLQVHTYGIGLAITFYVGYKLFERRLKNHGFNYEWLTTAFLWVIISSIVGARIIHVIANFSFYKTNPSQIVQVWHGGLSSYGGLLGGIPTGLYVARKKCPELSFGVAVDLVAPVLMISWAIGRLLGPQLMINGGGRPTNEWFGMYYAGSSPDLKRLPVPLFQAIECAAVYLIVLKIEARKIKGPIYITAISAIGLWDLTRFFDEFLYLDYPKRLWDAVEVASLILVAFATVAYVLIVRNYKNAGSPVVDRLGPIAKLVNFMSYSLSFCNFELTPAGAINTGTTARTEVSDQSQKDQQIPEQSQPTS